MLLFISNVIIPNFKPRTVRSIREFIGIKPRNNVVILLYDTLTHYSISDESMAKTKTVGQMEKNKYHVFIQT